MALHWLLGLGLAAQPGLVELNNEGVRAHAVGSYSAAFDMLSMALANAESSGVTERSLLSAILANLAETEVALGRLSAAEDHANRAIELASHPGRARRLTVLGYVYTRQGRFQEGEQPYRRALAIKESAATFNNLAECLLLQRRYDAALIEARKSAELAANRERAAALETMGRILLELGQWDSSSSALREALEISGRELGPRHPRTLAVRNSLGALARARGQFKEAEEVFEGVLPAFESVYGRNHPETATAMQNLADARSFRKQGPEIEALFAGALEICERALPYAHPQTLHTAANYLGYLRRAGKRQSADRIEGKLRTWIEQRQRDDPATGVIIDFRSLRQRRR